MASAFQVGAFQSGAFQMESVATVTTAGRAYGTQYRRITISRERREAERAARKAQRQALEAALAEQQREAIMGALPPELMAQITARPFSTDRAPEVMTLDAFARAEAAEDEDFLLLASN